MSFNLVIERLIISSGDEGEPTTPFTLFQSRNREAYNFKSVCLVCRTSAFWFQSRNREAYNFKLEMHRKIKEHVTNVSIS